MSTNRENDDPRMTHIGERFAGLATDQLERYLALGPEIQESIDRLASRCQEIEGMGGTAGVILKNNGNIRVEIRLSEPSPWLLAGGLQ